MAEGGEKGSGKIDAPREQIRIPAVTLRDRIQIGGKDIWGRDATMSLEPVEKSGWYLRVQEKDGTQKDVLITPEMLRTKNHHLYLEYEGRKYARVCEHLLPLRFAGIDGICIVPKPGSEWLPYAGGGLIFWEAVEKHLKPSDPLRPMQTNVDVSVNKTEKSGLHRTASLKTNASSGELDASALVDFPQYGGREKLSRKLPRSIIDMHDLFAAPPLGKPLWLEPVLRLAAKFGWPHVDKILWPKAERKNDELEIPKEVLLQIALHRYFDMLGTMAVAPGPGEYLTGTLRTERGNHELDVALIRAMIELRRSQSAPSANTEAAHITPRMKVSFSLVQAIAPMIKRGPAHWGEASKKIFSKLNINPIFSRAHDAGFTEMREHLNTPGTPTIFIANHPSPLDVSLIFSILTRPDLLLVVQKKNLERWEGFLGKGNIIGVSGDKDDIVAMREAVRSRLSQGGAVVYFPTGGLDAEIGRISFRSGFRSVVEDAPENTLIHAMHIDPSAGRRIRDEIVGPPRTPDENPEQLSPSMHVRRAPFPLDVAINEKTTPIADWKALLDLSSDSTSLNQKLTDYYLGLMMVDE